MRLLALLIKGRLLDEMGERISDLTEPQIDGWLKGHVSLADELLGRHGQAIMDHRETALVLLDEMTADEVRERLLCARADMGDCWTSPEFDRAFEREVRRIRDYLGTEPTGPTGVCAGHGAGHGAGEDVGQGAGQDAGRDAGQ